MGRRTLLLLASILVAAAGTALIWRYVQSSDERAQANWRMVTVLRAKAPINPGASGTVLESSIEEVQLPRQSVPAGALADRSALRGKVATVPVLAGQFILAGQFEATGSTSGIGEGKQAVTVALEDAQRVAGLLHPNMRVAVYYIDQGAGKQGSVAVLAPNVKVLAVGNTTMVRNSLGQPAQIGTQSGVPATNVTVEVDGKQALQFVMAASKGQRLWFTALGDKAVVDPGDAISGADLPVKG
jgi:pilus assembly protein CpaB